MKFLPVREVFSGVNKKRIGRQGKYVQRSDILSAIGFVGCVGLWSEHVCNNAVTSHQRGTREISTARFLRRKPHLPPWPTRFPFQSRVLIALHARV